MTRLRPTPLTFFLGALAAVLAAYTWLAWDMDWRTAAGRLGPGFFPRVIGITGLALCCVAAVRSLRGARASVDSKRKITAEEGEEAARHPWPLAVVCGALVAFLVLLIPLGAVFAPALFMFGMSWLLAREHLVRNAVVSVAVPVVLYALFEIVLDAGLPEGLLIPLP